MPIIDTEIELNKDLSFVTLANGENSENSENSLRRTSQDSLHCLPGQARISLENAPLNKYLRGELLTPSLDKIAPYLSLVRMVNGNELHMLTVTQGVHTRLCSYLRPPLPSLSRPQCCRYRKCLSPPRMVLRPDIHQTFAGIPSLVRFLGIC